MDHAAKMGIDVARLLVEGRPEELWAPEPPPARLTRRDRGGCLLVRRPGLGWAALPFAEALFGRLPVGGSCSPGRSACSSSLSPSGSLRAWASSRSAPERERLGRGPRDRSVILRRYGLGRLGPVAGGRSIWLVGEVVFTVAFFGWSLLRSFSPDVWNTEKPMDMAFVNADRAESFPPHDPWQSGTDVNYYYFGHYLVAFLVRLTGIDSAVASTSASRSSSRSSRRRLRRRRDAVRGRAAERGCPRAPRFSSA